MARELQSTDKFAQTLIKQKLGIDTSPMGKVRTLGEAVSDGLSDIVAPVGMAAGMGVGLAGYLKTLMPRISKFEIFDRVIRGHGLRGTTQLKYQNAVQNSPVFQNKLKKFLKRIPEEVYNEGLELKDLQILNPTDYARNSIGVYVPRLPKEANVSKLFRKTANQNRPRAHVKYDSTKTQLLGKNGFLEVLTHEALGGHHLEAWARNEVFGNMPKVLSVDARNKLSHIFNKRAPSGKLLGKDTEEFAESAVQLFLPEHRGVGFRGLTEKDFKYKVTSKSMKDVRDVIILANEKRLKDALVKAAGQHRKGVKLSEGKKEFFRDYWINKLSKKQRDEIIKMVMPNVNK